MKFASRQRICSVLLATASVVGFEVRPIFVSAETPAINLEMPDSQARSDRSDRRFNQLITESSKIYRAVVDNENNKVPAAITKNARCIVVLPNVVTGALFFGGAYGDGVASCRTPGGLWSAPAPIALTQGSIGLQAGTKTADLVLFFETDEAVQQLKIGDLSFGRNFSAVAGTYDHTVDTSDANVVVYSRSNGIFAGMSFAGSRIVKDDDCIKNYYGEQTTYLNLLDGTNVSNADDASYKVFTSLLPS